MDFKHTICTEDIRNKETFMAKMKNDPITLDGTYPSDHRLRTDVAIALIKTGLMKHTGWGDTCTSLHPFTMMHYEYEPDKSFRLTFVDWDRVKEETQ